MIKKIQERIFPFLIALSALSVSASAAFYSVSGLSKLFAGATLAVIIMATSLEVAKLIIASLLYQYRKALPKLLKIYLSVACVILIGITSMGIYGFLSSAYQETANKDGLVTQQVEALETKKKLYEDTRSNILEEKQSLAELKGTLSKGSTTQFTDKNGNLVVRSNNAAVKQIESANKSDENLTSKLDIVNDSIFSLETQILEVKTNGDAASELGPLKYLSELTGVEMNKIINWLLLVIIFVFDPLAIALVIAANFAFAQLNSKKEYPLEEQVDDMREVVNTYDDLEDQIKRWEEDSLTDLQNDNEWEFFPPEHEDKPNESEELEKKVDELTNKYNSLVEYLSQSIEIENQDDMKLFSFLQKKKPEVIEEQPIEIPQPVETPQVEEIISEEPEIIEAVEPQEEPKLNVTNDELLTEEDLKKIREKLTDPTIPGYKREYWRSLEQKILKRLNSDKDDTITYN